MAITSSATRRHVLKAGAALAAGVACPLVLPARTFAQSAGTQSINMQLGWLANNNQLGEIVAKRLGYFEEERIKFVIQPGGPSIDGVAIVASGRYEIGQVSSSPSLLLAASQGIPVKCFAVGAQQHGGICRIEELQPHLRCRKRDITVGAPASFAGRARNTSRAPSACSPGGSPGSRAGWGAHPVTSRCPTRAPSGAVAPGAAISVSTGGLRRRRSR